MYVSSEYRQNVCNLLFVIYNILIWYVKPQEKYLKLLELN
jgi:hypothetical protein